MSAKRNIFLSVVCALAFICAIFVPEVEALPRQKGKISQRKISGKKISSAQKKNLQRKNSSVKSTVHSKKKNFSAKKNLVQKKNSLRKKISPKLSASPEVRAQQNELQRLQNEINETRRKISQLSNTEHSTLKNLQYSQKHSANLTRHIELLEGQLSSLQSSIQQAEQKQTQLKSKLQNLQSEYSDLIKTMYKEKAQNANEMIETGKIDQNKIIRKKYLESLTARLNQYSREIAKVQDSIAEQKNFLEDQSHRQENILHTKSREQTELERSIVQNKKSLDDIRTNKTLLQKQLDEKEKSVRAIAGIIQQLIAKEIAERKAREEKIRQEKIAEQKRREERKREQLVLEERKRELARKEALTKREEQEKEKIAKKQEELKREEKADKGRNENLASLDGGASVKENYERAAFQAGGLPWPVGTRKILHPFGQYKNPVSNTTLENPGIDIAASRGSSVQAVADGIVSLIHFLPGYGSLVIINHENGFRSVYANLTAASVREGQRIKGGNLIGRSGESVDGEFLHFELWREKQRLNPMQWLR